MFRHGSTEKPSRIRCGMDVMCYDFLHQQSSQHRCNYPSKICARARGVYLFPRCDTNFIGRVTVVNISSLFIKAMLESVYTSKVFPGTGPHLSLHSFCIFKVIFYLQLLLAKHVVSGLELPIWPFKRLSSKRKPGYCFSRGGDEESQQTRLISISADLVGAIMEKHLSGRSAGKGILLFMLTNLASSLATVIYSN